MKYLDNDDFVSNEVLPKINLTVQNFLESEYSYIENEEDLEDLENADVDNDLIDEVLSELKTLVKACSNEYDFTKVNEMDIKVDDIQSMVESAFYDYKEIMIERFNEQFEREEYLDEYYSDEENDY